MTKLSTKQGFTLAELMVTVAVMAIMLMGLFAALTTSLYTSENSKWQVRQQKLAQLIMEELLSKPYGELEDILKTTTNTPTTISDTRLKDGTLSNNVYTIEGWEYDGSSGLKATVTMHIYTVDIIQITILVEVPGREGRPPFVLSTMRGRNSL